MTPGPEKISEPATSRTRNGDVEKRNQGHHELTDPPIVCSRAARIDQLSRAGVRSHKPGRYKGQPDGGGQAANPRRQANTDDAVTEAACSCHPSRRFKEVAQCHNLDHRQGSKSGEAEQKRNQSEDPLRRGCCTTECARKQVSPAEREGEATLRLAWLRVRRARWSVSMVHRL